MTKRPCPFEADLLPQCKIHVEQKHVNNGVSRDLHMNSVYDKTLRLLKEGSKKYSQIMNVCEELCTLEKSSSEEESPIVQKSRPRIKQTILSDNMKLIRVEEKGINSNIDICDSCCLFNSVFANKCFYCDKTMCSYCLASCNKCHELFCHDCSLPIYDMTDKTDSMVCLGCYK
ncbi:apoptosis regulatory protein Siva-like [Prorops nasuta]|uniref:apoptosis regulatory protein Siva-like n=1 Tax=Prorops nasuta TaxID=863751 RepID=UPI0034CECEA2